MKNLIKIILIFLIIIFSVSSAYADTENNRRRPAVIKRMENHNFNKRPFCHARVLLRQVHYKRKPIILDRQQDTANIYFIPGGIALAAIAYLTSEKYKNIWQHVFIRMRIRNFKHNYIIGVQRRF